jgi:N-acetyl sugar amidotransferase
MSNITICSKCVLPETAESVGFNSANECSVCDQIDFKQNAIDWSKRLQDLKNLADDHRGKKDYDCIVPFSGGKDSTFTLWYLVTQLEMKCLVVKFDHGFMRPGVQENADKAFRKLGVDVIQFTPNWQVVRKLMFESLVRRGDFCWHCHSGIFSYPMWVSLKWDVPLLFWGEPGAEYSSFYSYDEVEEADERRFNRKANLGINAEDIGHMLDDSISDYKVTSRDLLPYTYPPGKELKRAGVRSVFLGSYIPWDVRSQVEIIERELDWKRQKVEGIPPQYGYEKIECYMQGVRDYIKFLKRGFGRTTHLASIDIRNGRLTREGGLKLVTEFDGKKPAALKLFLDILEIDEEKFHEIVSRHTVAPHVTPEMGAVRTPDAPAPDDFAEFENRIKQW